MNTLAELYDEITRSTAQRFPGKEEGLVFGSGSAGGCRMLLLGEAPGEQEVLQKRPFSGKAGKNLDEFLELAGINRNDIYISNTVKLRPCEYGKTGRLHNRPPSREELDFFIPYLLKEIGLIDPPFIVTLGNTPMMALLGKEIGISACHGTWRETQDHRPVYCLYHPAAVIYRRELKEVYRQDVRALGLWLKEHTR